MVKIVLASESNARKKLLKKMGIKFSVAGSNVRESKSLEKGCGALVINNALRKAVNAAKALRSGIVIAADTVVLAGGKVVGKPRDIRDASKTLKLLSKAPQWVYTGIAVIEVESKKKFTDYDKTKIYMRRMTDKEIAGYFKKTSPLDKAGSFDIQGEGSLFIERIKGSFHNVVGLPVKKLSGILKKLGVRHNVPGDMYEK
ncbi:MAG: septum formation protein Maf [Candidatus Omnitrophica bacterium CG1_02_49_10]|nr:MAG: septum formation protein Maf [Candidatus Omnitrophica bacterium CG1_02_49_10]